MRVAINGVGIAGPCLAYWLERSGHEVVLIEKAPHFRGGGYVVGFWSVGYTVAERMGILPEVRERGYRGRELRAVDGRGRKESGFTTDFLFKSTVYVTHTTPGRQVGRFSLRGDRTMFGLLFRSELMTGPEPLNPMERKAILRQVFGDAGWECPRILHAMDQIADVYYDRVSQIKMDRWSKGRVMLIGDAAACVSLLGGEGAGLAMAEAYVLAGELNRAGPDYQAAFRRYEELLRPFVEARQKSGRYFAAALVPKTRIGVRIRNLAMKLMALPLVAHYFLSRQLRDDFDLPNYLVHDERR